MISETKYLITYEDCTEASVLAKGTWLVLLNPSRIPHIGLMIDGNYNSLTVKGSELNVSCEALLKTISLKRIETLFLGLKKLPGFDFKHLINTFQHQLSGYTAVTADGATCLTPLKLFFEEFYGIENNPDQLFYDFVDELYQKDCITGAYGLNIVNKKENNIFTLPHYTKEELQNRITDERSKHIKP